MTKYNKYNDLICRYYASHADIPPGNHDGETIGIIVRCKDCKHWSADDNETYCEELGIFGTSPNSFCSFARKKEEPTMEEFMYGQNLGNPEDGSL